MAHHFAATIRPRSLQSLTASRMASTIWESTSLIAVINAPGAKERMEG
jgi:hypothetical protein